MSIIYDSSVSGVNTPSAITGVIADRPAANTVQDGTVFISTDTQEIFSAKAGAWVKVTGGGGGGSQNLAQVLTVGNRANNQTIRLDNNTSATNLGQLYFTNNEAKLEFINGSNTTQTTEIINDPTYSLFALRTKINNNLREYCRIVVQQGVVQLDANNPQNLGFQSRIDTIEAYSLVYSNSDPSYPSRIFNKASGDITYLETETFNSLSNAINRKVRCESNKNNALLKVTNNQSFTIFDEIKLDATNNNAQINLRTALNNQRIEIRTNTAAGGTYITLTNIDSNVNRECQISVDNLRYTDTQNNRNTYIYPSFDPVGLQYFTPEFSGIMANVNEKIIDNNVDMSVNDYQCQQYGVYVVTTGSNTNDFILDGFVNNGVDGQFITICASGIPIRCTNGVGNIYGTARINSLGLFKLMKFGNDIYSSHI